MSYLENLKEIELLLLILAVFGGVDLAGRGIVLLGRAFPPILSLQIRFWRAIGALIKVKSFQRKAVALHIEGAVNQIAFSLEKHLPKGWIKRARINWVTRATAGTVQNGEIVMRVEPHSGNDQTLMNAVWAYFQDSLYPETRDILPRQLTASTALAVTRAGLSISHSHLIREFDSAFVATARAKAQNLIDMYADCTRLNEYGFLMSAFLRETDYAASSLRFLGQAETVTEAIAQITDHMLAFQPLLRNNKPDEQWSFHGPGGSYGFILVSRPKHLRNDLDAYAARAQRFYDAGVERIYILGRSEEKAFVERTIESVLSMRHWQGVDLFPLFRDYRGALGGVCALVAVDPILQGLTVSPRPLKLTGSIPGSGVAPEVSVTSQDNTLAAGDGSKGELHDKELSQRVDDMMVRLSDYEGEWIALTEFGSELRKSVPDFTPRTYGERNLVSVLKRLPQLELEERGAGVYYVRVKAGYSPALLDKTRALRNSATVVCEIVQRYATSEWVYLSTVGQLVRRYYPQLDLTEYGMSSLHEFVEASGLFEIDERGEGFSKTYVKVRDV